MLAMARPLAVVVAGLGEEGKLRAVDLVYTVRQAVIAYAQRLAESESGAPAEFELAATLIGSGGTGISAGSVGAAGRAGRLGGEPEAARQRLAAGRPPDPGRVLPRPRERRLARAAGAGDGGAEPAQGRRLRQSGAGALRRSLDSSYRGAAYDFISALDRRAARTARRRSPTRSTPSARAPRCARSRRRRAWSSELVAKASNDANRDAQIGHTLFDLLVPVEMEPFLGGTSEMVIELDRGTAALPWEVLDTSSAELSGSDPRPWAIRSKLLRKLRTSEFRAQVVGRRRRRQHPRHRRADARRGRCTRRCPARAPRRSPSRRG